MKLERLKICLNEIFSRVRVDEPLSDIFPSKNVLKQDNVSSPLLFKFVLDCH